MVRAGLFLYDHLGGRKLLPPTRSVALADGPLKPGFPRGFEYSDCWVDDARLVVANARDAALHGADIRTRTRCTAARPVDGVWSLTLDPGGEAHARVLVNAAGPWVSQVLSGVAAQNAPTRVRLVKGSHIVTRRLFPGERAFIFQNADGRVCFAIPYQGDFTLVGTTDEDYDGDPRTVAISPAEETYLLGAVNTYLRTPVTAEDIVWRYAGVRPLRDDGASKAQEATRDYVLELTGTPPVLSVFGGKITTYRRLAEAAMAKLAPYFRDRRPPQPVMPTEVGIHAMASGRPEVVGADLRRHDGVGLPGPWTEHATLPGGDFPWDGLETLVADLLRRTPTLPPTTARRLARAYGTEAAALAENPGADLGAGLTEREIDWLVRHEYARTAEDILWRRTKLGLRFTPEQTERLAHHLAP
jgi:glycerol-3-phosphate dehydrogenase